MKLGKLLLRCSFIVSSLLADISYRGIIGNWEVSSMNDNRKVFFNNQYENIVEVNINRDGTITSPYGDSKYYMIDNNILTFGKFDLLRHSYRFIINFEILLL